MSSVRGPLRVLLPLFYVAMLASTLRADCGSSTCPIELRAIDALTVRFSVDLSSQWIDQNQPRIGTRHATIGERPSDHDEISTLNRITTLQLNYAVTPRLQLGLNAPFVSRSHEHFDVESAQIERWDFSAPGDVALQGRWRMLDLPERNGALSLTGAVKLPTGARHERDTRGGEVAEVTLQPGTGSIDVSAGLHYQGKFLRETALEGMLGHTTAIPWFASATLRRNGRGTEDYRRGHELQLNAGTQYPLTRRFDLLAQLNFRATGKDDPGATGENRDWTGGQVLYASPGLRATLAPGLSAYAYVQLPLYQQVNGLQLTSARNYVIGVHQNF